MIHDRPWRFLLSILFISAALGLLLLPEMSRALTRPTDKAWARVEQSGVIRFALHPAYMPFDGLGSHGDFFGLDVDIANELARRLGQRAEFVIAGYDSLYDVLRVGQAEATISALPIEPSKLDLWAYSTPYFDAGQALLMKPAKVPLFQQGSLAVEYGSDADAAARYLARRRVGIAIKYVSSADEAVQAMLAGEVDAAMLDGIRARQLISRNADLSIVEQVTSEPYAIAVWGESPQLLAALNSKLGEMKQDGAIQRIIDEWMKK